MSIRPNPDDVITSGVQITKSDITCVGCDINRFTMDLVTNRMLLVVDGVVGDKSLGFFRRKPRPGYRHTSTGMSDHMNTIWLYWWN